MDTAYLSAIDSASLEVEEGRFEPNELEQIVDKATVLNCAISLLEQS